VCITIDFKPIVPVSPRQSSLSVLHFPFFLVEPALLLGVGDYITRAVAKQVAPNCNLLHNPVCLTPAEADILNAKLGQLRVVQLVQGEHGVDSTGKETPCKLSKTSTKQPDLELSKRGGSCRDHSFVVTACLQSTREPPGMKFFEFDLSLRTKWQLGNQRTVYCTPV
jgi:hypothetical protein